MLKLDACQRRGGQRRRSHFLTAGLVGRLDIHGHQGARDFGTNCIEQQSKQFESLALVLLLRILLGEAAQMNALTQMVECCEVLAPVRVDAREHH
jgi:hypothetical protein